MIKCALIIMLRKWMLNNNERVFKLLRPLNTLYGRDVMELEWMECDECDDK